MLKKDFCEILSLAKDWESSKSLVDAGLKSLIERIKTVSKFDGQFYEGGGSIFIAESVLSERAYRCFEHSIILLGSKKYGESLHELHDSIYVFGKNLDQELSDLEHYFIFTWLNLYQFSRSAND